MVFLQLFYLMFLGFVAFDSIVLLRRILNILVLSSLRIFSKSIHFFIPVIALEMLNMLIPANVYCFFLVCRNNPTVSPDKICWNSPFSVWNFGGWWNVADFFICSINNCVFNRGSQSTHGSVVVSSFSLVLFVFCFAFDGGSKMLIRNFNSLLLFLNTWFWMLLLLLQLQFCLFLVLC